MNTFGNSFTIQPTRYSIISWHFACISSKPIRCSVIIRISEHKILTAPFITFANASLICKCLHGQAPQAFCNMVQLFQVAVLGMFSVYLFVCFNVSMFYVCLQLLFEKPYYRHWKLAAAMITVLHCTGQMYSPLCLWHPSPSNSLNIK